MGSVAGSVLGHVLLLAVFTLLIRVTSAGNTTCISKQMDWYSSVVGESPCVTYERLRQICNIDYQVPNFRPNTPGDQCDDQVASCCCNTIAFQLSMLCMNCQYDTVDGSTIGIDAGVGAYGLYKGNCGAGTNRSLPEDIQTAVCNKNIRLDNYLYGGWDDGAWFYVWTKENAGRDHAVHNNNTFTHCADQISPSPTPTRTSSSSTVTNAVGSAVTSTSTTTTNASNSSTSPSSSDTGSTQSADVTTSTTKRTNTGAIVGGVIGGAAVIVVTAIIVTYWRMSHGGQNGRNKHAPFRNNPAMTSVGPVLSRDGAARPMTRYGDVIDEPWLRHEDAGPATALIRPPSGRLPPAYRAWNESNLESTLGPSDSPSQVNRSQMFHSTLSELGHDTRGMVLEPLRRQDTKEDIRNLV